MSQIEAVAKIRQAITREAKELDLREMGLRSIPSILAQATQLETLYLDRNELQSLPLSLGSLRKLRILSVRENQLTSLPNSLNQLDLTQLYLDHNKLTKVPGLVWEMANLTGLGLSGIHRPSLRPIHRLSKLHTLYLNNCNFHALPGEVCELEELSMLQLSGNELSDLPYTVINLQNLQYFDLSLNNFRYTPNALLRLRKLKSLTLNNNRLVGLPEKIADLRELTSLSIAHNELTVLPRILGKLPKLERLFAYSMEIREIESGFSEASVLQHLALGSNRLSLLPFDFYQLQNLDYLSLFNNQFEVLPAPVCALGKLRELSVDSNQLTRLPAEIGDLQRLERLDVRNNQLVAIPREIGRLTNLRELRLASNQLTSLPEEIGKLDQLTDLNLSFNSDLAVFPASFIHLTQLRTLQVNFIGVDIPNESAGSIPQIRRYLSSQTGASNHTTQHTQPSHSPASTARSEHNMTDRFDINFLPDIEEIKEDERRLMIREEELNGSPIRISRFELDGIVSEFPYRKLQIVYTFEHNLLPVPPWVVARLFLARTHRFRTSQIWRGGGVLAYETQEIERAQHIARLDSSVWHNALAVTVTGSFPQNFFTLLTAGIDRVIAGLSRAQVVHRVLFCPDPDSRNCRHRFDYDAIVHALSRPSSDDEPFEPLVVSCPECRAEVDFHKALLGMHRYTEPLMAEIQAGLETSTAVGDRDHPAILNTHHQMVALRQRDFLLRFQAPQESDEGAHFLRVFVLRLMTGNIDRVTADNLFEQDFALEVFCEMPGAWHYTGVRIPLNNPQASLTLWRPYLLELKEVLPTLRHTADDEFMLTEGIAQMERIIDLIPAQPDTEMADALASLNRFWVLSQGHWSNELTKIRTPEGHYMWLEADHRIIFD